MAGCWKKGDSEIRWGVVGKRETVRSGGELLKKGRQ